MLKIILNHFFDILNQSVEIRINEKLMFLPCKSIILPNGSVIMNFKRVSDILCAGTWSFRSKNGIVVISPYGNKFIFLMMCLSPSREPYELCPSP